VKRTIRSLAYSGNRFECPFCGGRFRKLLPAGLDSPVLARQNVVGGSRRSNAMCPRCSSLDRERLIYLYLLNKTDVFAIRTNQDIRLLHIAPEKNLQKVLVSFSNIRYVSADIDSPLATTRIDVTDIGFKDDTFDAILCSHVLEHVPNDLKALSELLRVSKPGAWAILQVPISLSLPSTYEDPSIAAPEERMRQFGQSDHVRIYAKDYKNRLESAGFSVEVYSFAKEYGKAAARKYGLTEEEELYICSKPNQQSRCPGRR